jgi:mannose-6-phosphate isomerase-like protein (cupin superfamily)
VSTTVAQDARNGVRLTVDEVEKKIPASGIRSVAAFEHGTLLAKLYVPRGHDPQKPHTRDEVYIVASGSGTFVAGDKRHPFGPGDFLFVPAHVVHRFEEFSDDLRLWVLFYGPEGGEAA